jgi:hypothetical protein
MYRYAKLAKKLNAQLASSRSVLGCSCGEDVHRGGRASAAMLIRPGSVDTVECV